MFILDPSSCWFFHPRSLIGSNNNNKKISKKIVLPFFVAIYCTKLYINLFLKTYQNFLEPIDQKLLPSSPKYGLATQDPGKLILDPDSRVKKHRIPDHCNTGSSYVPSGRRQVWHLVPAFSPCPAAQWSSPSLSRALWLDWWRSFYIYLKVNWGSKAVKQSVHQGKKSIITRDLLIYLLSATQAWPNRKGRALDQPQPHS